jgi:hypothetical protein
VKTNRAEVERMFRAVLADRADGDKAAKDKGKAKEEAGVDNGDDAMVAVDWSVFHSLVSQPITEEDVKVIFLSVHLGLCIIVNNK